MKNHRKMYLVIMVVVLLMTVSCENKPKDEVKDPVEKPVDVASKDLGLITANYPSTFNYLKSDWSDEVYYYPNLIDGLVEFNKDNEIIPSLASSWTVKSVNEKQVWTFKIKENIAWLHNDDLIEYDENVKANDWVASAKFILDPKSNSNLSHWLTDYLDGADNYYCSLSFDYAKEQGAETPACVNETEYHYNTDFAQVGVKAIDEQTLEYTLKEPTTYFLSLLTYNAYYPVNEKYLLEKGETFGYQTEDILINGAYSIEYDYLGKKIVLYKNEKYWDRDNVLINKVTYHSSFGDITPDYFRYMFENGKIDRFVVFQSDEEGWEKYITGKEGNGSLSEPYSPYVNLQVDESPNTYVHLFNFDRTNFDESSLSQAEHNATAKAILNDHFRLGLLHGIHRSTLAEGLSQDFPQKLMRNSVVQKDYFYDQNGRDYFEYLVDTFSDKTTQTLQNADSYLSDDRDSLYDVAMAKEKFLQAKEELISTGLTEEDFPIKFEVALRYSEVNAAYCEAFRDEFNKEFGDLFEMILIHRNQSLNRINSKSYDIHMNVLLDEEYFDPVKILDGFAPNGEMLATSNIDQELSEALLHDFNDLVNQAKEKNDFNEVNERYLLISEAEYHLIFEKAVLIPGSHSNREVPVVTRIKPGTTTTVRFGLDRFKHKGMFVYDEPLSWSK